MTTLKSAGNSGAAKIIDAKLEMLDEQARHRLDCCREGTTWWKKAFSLCGCCKIKDHGAHDPGIMCTLSFNPPLDTQIEEAAKDMLSAVEQVDADERAITLRKRLLAAVNRLLVGCAKDATLLSVRLRHDHVRLCQRTALVWPLISSYTRYLFCHAALFFSEQCLIMSLLDFCSSSARKVQGWPGNWQRCTSRYWDNQIWLSSC